MASGAWSNTNTTSLTLPTGAIAPDEGIYLDGTSDTILVYDANGDLIASVAATAGTDAEGNNYPAGISSSSGFISQSIILLYNGVPASGNLVMSLSASAGTDTFGNNYQSGFTVYDNMENVVRSIDFTGLDTIGSSTESQFTIDPNTGLITLFTDADAVTAIIDAEHGSMNFYTTTTTTTTITSNGSFVVPVNINTVIARAWGGGGGGQNGSGAGGAGGEFAEEPALTVTPGETLTLTMSTGGTGGTTGTPHGGNAVSTTIKRGATTLVIAHGGLGSTSGTTAATSGSTNTIHHNGGGAAVTTSGLSHGGGGGGGSGGSSAAGNTGGNNSGTTGGTGGAAVTGGAKGGNGGNGTGTTGTAGQSGTAPGGGGGSGGAGSLSGSNGGAGGRGQVQFTYTNTATMEISIASVAGTDEFGNAYPAGIQVGTPTGSRIYMNPTGPTFSTINSANKLTTEIDGVSGTIWQLDNSSLLFNALVSNNANTQPGLFLGEITTAGVLPTTTQLNNAASVIGNPGSLSIYSGVDPSDPSLTAALEIDIGVGTEGDGLDGNTASVLIYGTDNDSDPVAVYVSGTVYQDTDAYGIITLPGTSGGGTTTTTVTGLDLTPGANGQWMVILTANTAVPGTDLKYVSYSGASSDGFTAHMNRTTNTDTSVSYHMRGI